MSTSSTTFLRRHRPGQRQITVATAPDCPWIDGRPVSSCLRTPLGPVGSSGASVSGAGRSRVRAAADPSRGQLRVHGVIDVSMDIVVTDAIEDAVTGQHLADRGLQPG
jgi:hypothetical protein